MEFLAIHFSLSRAQIASFLIHRCHDRRCMMLTLCPPTNYEMNRKIWLIFVLWIFLLRFWDWTICFGFSFSLAHFLFSCWISSVRLHAEWIVANYCNESCSVRSTGNAHPRINTTLHAVQLFMKLWLNYYSLFGLWTTIVKILGNIQQVGNTNLILHPETYRLSWSNPNLFYKNYFLLLMTKRHIDIYDIYDIYKYIYISSIVLLI